jgi:hypothetical protein
MKKNFQSSFDGLQQMIEELGGRKRYRILRKTGTLIILKGSR